MRIMQRRVKVCCEFEKLVACHKQPTMSLHLVTPHSPDNSAERQPIPAIILYNHVAHKGMQGFSVLGALLGFAFSRGQVNAAETGARYGLAIGLPVAVAITTRRMTSDNRWHQPIQWQDRAWRLHHNHRQTWIDWCSEVGAVVGWANGRPALGFAGGTVLGTVTSRLIPQH